VRLRHSVALALVGWYLVVPPTTTSSGGMMLNPHTPLRLWQIQGTFVSKPDCENALSEYTSDPENNPFYRAATDPIARKALAQEKIIADCIASGDPRLKEK
jgi:hypothetical protein